MKKFRKNKAGLFICEECGKLCKNLRGLAIHIRYFHNKKSKEYYDKWIKEKNEGLCKICRKKAIFLNINYGYYSGCCKKHMNKWNQIQIKKAVRKKYGVDNVFQLEEIKQKIRKTNLKKYGYEYTHQNRDILEKAFKSGFKIKQFRNTNIWYQGSYELDFLEKYFDKFPNIKRGPAIKYQINGNFKIYFPDFIIPSLNLIIECKSSYYYNMHKEKVDIKKKAIINKGFKYYMILDKNYDKLF